MKNKAISIWGALANIISFDFKNILNKKMQAVLNKYLVVLFIVTTISSCYVDTNESEIPKPEFGYPSKVQMIGFEGNMMEPFLSRDGKILFFNNLNNKSENTNLHWSIIINDSTFKYQGEISGVNTLDLEGVPTLDNSGNFYFVSTRDYPKTLSTLYQGTFNEGKVNSVKLIDGVSRLQGGWVNFDIEVSVDGQFLYFVDARFDQAGGPYSADFVVAKKNNSAFERLSNSDEIFKYINTYEYLEYAACISEDQLELYFTRAKAPLNILSVPEMMVSTRKTKSESFSAPKRILNITGFAEAFTISSDSKKLYFHQKEGEKFVIKMISKK